MITLEDVSVLVDNAVTDKKAATDDKAATTKNSAPQERAILKNISVTLKETKIALIGPNGSGKSTLAKLINGLVEPTSGSVKLTINNETLDTKKDGKKIRQKVGFVFTDPRAGLVMPTVIEDVSLSLRRLVKNKGERSARALQVLADYGLADQQNQSVHTLSGGQSQLLAIAAILAVEPSIIVADEPTTLLDLRNSKMISELLLRIPQQLVVATHDLDFAARCDRVLWIENGRIVFDGDPATGVAKYRESA